MTALLDAQPAATSDGPRPRHAIRIVVAIAALLAAAVVLTVTGRSAETTVPLHPHNPTATGAQALARVLDSRGVPVTIALGEAALRAASVDSTTTLVVTDTSQLRDATVTSLDAEAKKAGRVVLVNPGVRALRTLVPGVGTRSVGTSATLTAECTSSSGVRRGETLSRLQMTFRATGGETATAACFVTDGYAGYLELTPRNHRPTVLIGSVDVVANSRITQADNAAIAVRAMGQLSRVVWYVPDLRDAPLSPPVDEQRIVPEWFGPILILGLFAFGAVMIWRGRRLGRLVAEPLPVVVRALETTESRGRLYRKARDGQRASEVLQEATRRRLTAYLGLPHGTTPHSLVDALIPLSSRQPDHLWSLLAGPPAGSETDMLALAAELAALEKEIRRS